MDLAVKYRFFRHLCVGDDPDSERLYIWHIESRKAANAKINLGMDSKSGTDQYVTDCRNLLISMANRGFDPAYAIPVDPDGELLGGAHRVACALALGIETVPVERKDQRVWAPAWDRQWFVDNGMSASDLERVAYKLHVLTDNRGLLSYRDRMEISKRKYVKPEQAA